MDFPERGPGQYSYAQLPRVGSNFGHVASRGPRRDKQIARLGAVHGVEDGRDIADCAADRQLREAERIEWVGHAAARRLQSYESTPCSRQADRTPTVIGMSDWNHSGCHRGTRAARGAA